MAAFTPTGVELLVKGSDKFFGTLNKANKGIVGFGKTIGKAAVAGTVAFGVAIAGAGVAMVKLASDAAEFAGIKDAFEGIAASAEGGQARMLAALKEGSLGMVTQRDLMATFNEAAMLVSDTFAQQLPDAMGFLSKVSVATGQDMGFMMDSLVKGVGRLSPMILDNLGIQVTLADATANAAEQFGVEADELTKTQIQAGMMNVVLEKLAENTAAMPEVAGTAAQAQAAFGVALKDTKDQIGLALLPTFTKLMTAVTGFAMKVLPKLVSAFQDKVVPAVEGVVKWIGKIIDAFGWLLTLIDIRGIKAVFTTFEDGSSILMGFFQQLGLGMDQANALSGAINKLVKFLGENIPKAVKAAKNFFTNILLPALSAVWDFILNSVIPAISDVVGWLSENIPVAIQMASDFWTDTLQPALEDVADFMLDDVIPAIENVVEFLTEKFDEAVTWVRANWPDIQATIEDVMDRVRDVIETVLNAVADFWDTHGAKILAAVKTYWNSIKVVIETVINVVKGIITAVMQAISGDWEGFWNTIKGIIDTIWAGIKTVIENTFNILANTIIPIALDAIQNLIEVAWYFLQNTLVPALWEGIKMAIKLVWYALVNTVIPTALDAIQTLIETAWNFLKDTLIPGIWNTIKDIIEAAWTAIKELVQDGVDAIVDIVEGVADAMYNAGKAIVENIKQGISDAWGALTEWFRDKLSDLTDLIPWSEPKDKSSPLFGLGKAGEAIVLNIAAGIRSAGSELIDALLEGLEGIDELFEAGGVLGGLGSFAAGMFKKETLDPLKDALREIQGTIKEITKDLNDQKESYADITEEMDEMFANLLDQTEYTDKLKDLAQDRLNVEQNIAQISEELAKLPAQEAAERERLTDQLEDQQWALEKLGRTETDLRDKIADTNREYAGLTAKYLEEEREQRTALNELLEDQQVAMEDILRSQVDLSAEIADTQAELAGLGEKYAAEEIARREEINELLDDQRYKLVDLEFAERDLREGYADEIEKLEEANKLREEAGEELLEILSLEDLLRIYMEDPLQLTREQYNVAKRLNGILESRTDVQERTVSLEEELANLQEKYLRAEAEERDALSRSLDQRMLDVAALARREIDLSDEMAATRIRLAELSGELTAEEEAERLELQNKLRGYYMDLEDLMRKMADLGEDATETERELLQLAVDYAQRTAEIERDLQGRQSALASIVAEEERIKAALEAQANFNELIWRYYNDQSQLTAEQIEMMDEYLRLVQERADLSGLISEDEANLLELQEEQAALAEEYRKEQERILALQKAQQQLGFLEQQMRLLDLIREHGLDAQEILGGLEFGVDANLGDLVDAMSAAIRAIVEQVEEELEIASSSRVFAKIGAQLMTGLAEGVQAMAQRPLQAVMRATMPLVAAPAAMAYGGSTTTNAQSYTFNTTIRNGMDQSQFETKVLRIVRGDVR